MKIMFHFISPCVIIPDYLQELSSNRSMNMQNRLMKEFGIFFIKKKPSEL